MDEVCYYCQGHAWRVWRQKEGIGLPRQPLLHACDECNQPDAEGNVRPPAGRLINPDWLPPPGANLLNNNMIPFFDHPGICQGCCGSRWRIWIITRSDNEGNEDSTLEVWPCRACNPIGVNPPPIWRE